jgi:PelA/Pel-15E family pectate lyase
MTRFQTIAFIAFLACSAFYSPFVRATDLSKRTDDWFRSREGKYALDCILSWQTDHGDWPKNIDTSTELCSGDRSQLLGTFDNGATTGELRALARAFEMQGDTRYKDAYLRGFDHILHAQYPNGGWPQYFPLRDGYYSRITFNDHCMVRLLEFLREALKSRQDGLLNKARRESAADAIDRGIHCILQCQVVVDGTPTVWCAQHDQVTLAPAGARTYELASLSGSESAGVLKFLMHVENPSPDVIRAVKAGVQWFESAKIKGIRVEKIDGDRRVIQDPSAPPVWARFYEIETNRPFFCDRDGVPKGALKDIGYERRNGYSWYGTWGDSVAEAYSKWPYH